MESWTWTGADQRPLRSESSFGVLLRVSAFNVIGRPLAQQLFCRAKSPRAGFSFYRTAWIDEGLLRTKLGWTWQPPETALVLPLDHLQDVLWAPGVRYCPLCMQGGFHAIWFQLAALQVCPFHGCRLTDRCCACCAPMGRYGLTCELFDQPLYCCHCRLPFAGTPVAISDHLDIWHLCEAIDASFDPYSRWLELARDRLICFDEAAAQGGQQGLSPHSMRILQSAVHDMVPYPQGCESRESRAVRYITWRVARTEARAVPFPSRYRYLSAGRALDVYRATLRMLFRGIGGHPSAMPALRLEFEGDRSTDLAEWSPSQLGLVLLRCAFELPCVLDLATGIDGISIRGSVFAAALVGNRLQRAACQILIIATYGALVARAREYIARGHMSRTHLVTSPRELIVLAAASVAGTHAGMAVMPVLDTVSPRLVARMSHTRFKAVERFNSAVIQMRDTREQT